MITVLELGYLLLGLAVGVFLTCLFGLYCDRRQTSGSPAPPGAGRGQRPAGGPPWRD